jgi:hypothetical protein
MRHWMMSRDPNIRKLPISARASCAENNQPSPDRCCCKTHLTDGDGGRLAYTLFRYPLEKVACFSLAVATPDLQR